MSELSTTQWGSTGSSIKGSVVAFPEQRAESKGRKGDVANVQAVK
jgi:hypothetical protein